MIKSCMSGDVRISYRERGSGEALVLLMGLGASGLKWEKHAACYEKYYHVIMPDNRGTGFSDKPKSESYTIAQMAQDTIAVMDDAGVGCAHIHGISMGGAIAQYLAIHYPERVKTVILTNTFSRCCVSFRRSIELLRDARGQLDGRTFGRLLQWIIFSSDFQQKHEEFLLYEEANDLDSVCPMPDYAFKAQCNAILGFDEHERLNQIKAPTLICAGDSDLFAPLPVTDEMLKGIPGAELYLCKHGGHVQHWENLEAFNAATLDFLLRHSGC